MSSAPFDSGQLTFDLKHRTSHARADFIVTQANKLAFDHINSFPGWPGPLTLITGPAKSGKTHLARIWAEIAQAQFMRPEEMAKMAGASGNTPLVLEDVDRAGFEEHEFFHLLNQCMREGCPVLMSARMPVSEWPFSSDDVKSRARLAAHFSVLAADDLQLCQMFAKLFDDRQVVVDPTIISYLVARMERSPAEVFALAEILDKLALAQGRPISRKIAAAALEQRLNAHQAKSN